MTDWESGLLDPIYSEDLLSTDAVIVTVAGRRVPVRAIDLTAGVVVDAMMQTMAPAATVRMSELASHGISEEHVKTDVVKGQMELNGKRWRISSRRFAPTGGGPLSAGEIMLILGAEGDSP